jgi:Spy/CpxP family protein refolding chaperone
MLALIRKIRKGIATALLLTAAVSFVSCASQKQQVAVVDDPDAKHESMVPWNKQEKWESQGNLGGITDRR